MNFDELKNNKLVWVLVFVGVIALFALKSNFSVSDWVFDKIACKVEERMNDGRGLYSPYGPYDPQQDISVGLELDESEGAEVLETQWVIEWEKSRN